ncbi:hypothetical protein [Ascidiimonas aurantiaca]|uniref:hypothetical protein n=1 Tax=Ascidiimonas aurantiaca TaxID=1685432 RepID=UPI0030EBBEA4
MNTTEKISCLYQVAKEVYHNKFSKKIEAYTNEEKYQIILMDELLEELKAEVTKERYNHIENHLRFLKEQACRFRYG